MKYEECANKCYSHLVFRSKRPFGRFPGIGPNFWIKTVQFENITLELDFYVAFFRVGSILYQRERMNFPAAGFFDSPAAGFLMTGAMGASALIEGLLIIHFTNRKHKSGKSKHALKVS